MPSDHTERLRRNAESKATAEHDGEPWSQDEMDVLVLWDGSQAELEALSELLGRTIEACRQRYHVYRRGERVEVTQVTRTVTRTTTTTVYRGWMESDGDGWS